MAAVVLCAIVMLALALAAPLNRDEHMYLAAATLLADHALYTDFVFPQPPLTAWFQRAVLAAWPGEMVLLPARLAQAAVSLSLLAVLLGLYRRVGASALMGAAMALLLVHTEVVRGSLGLARSHELALLLSLSPWLLLPVQPGGKANVWRLIAAGVLATLGVACRLTHLPLALLAVAWPALAPTTVTGGGREVKWPLLGALLAAVALVAALWGTDPAALKFSLVDYHLLNARFQETSALGRGLDLAGKLHDAARLYRRTDLAVWSALVVSAVVLSLGWGRAWSTTRWRLGLGLLLCGVVMVAVPRPIQNAYYWTLLVGGTVLVATASVRLVGRPRRVLDILVAVGVVVVMIHHAGDTVRLVSASVRPSTWPARVVHDAGRRLAGLTLEPHGAVVTTHPLYALEAGRPLDPAFSTGEFIWRLGETLEIGTVGRIGLVTARGLDAHLATRPPAAVIAVAAAPWDQPLSIWARGEGWDLHPLAGGMVVWLPE